MTSLNSNSIGIGKAGPLQHQQQAPSHGSMETTLRSAIEAGDTEKVLELLKLGVPIVIDQDGQTALHLASAAGHFGMVEALIQAGCDVGIQDFVSDEINF